MTEDAVVAAAKFLKEKGLSGKGISARRLAESADEMGLGLSATLSALADMLSDGQGRGMTQETEKAVS